MTDSIYLVRFGELGLKSRQVRNRFQQILANNLKRRLKTLEVGSRVSRNRSRLTVEGPPEAEEIIRRTFGIVSFSRARPVMTSLDSFKQRAVEIYRESSNEPSFAVRVKRMTKDTPYNSQDVGREAGAAVKEVFPDAVVNLSHPQLTIEFEIDTQNGSHSFYERISGPGGLPVGSAGRVVAVVEDERDMAAAWLMLRRGAALSIVTSNDKLLDPIRGWWPFLRLIEEPGEDLFQAAVDSLSEKGPTTVVVGWTAGRQLEGGQKTHLLLDPLVGHSAEELQTLIDQIRG